MILLQRAQGVQTHRWRGYAQQAAGLTIGVHACCQIRRWPAIALPGQGQAQLRPALGQNPLQRRPPVRHDPIDETAGDVDRGWRLQALQQWQQFVVVAIAIIKGQDGKAWAAPHRQTLQGHIHVHQIVALSAQSLDDRGDLMERRE